MSIKLSNRYYKSKKPPPLLFGATIIMSVTLLRYINKSVKVIMKLEEGGGVFGMPCPQTWAPSD